MNRYTKSALRIIAAAGIVLAGMTSSAAGSSLPSNCTPFGAVDKIVSGTAVIITEIDDAPETLYWYPRPRGIKAGDVLVTCKVETDNYDEGGVRMITVVDKDETARRKADMAARIEKITKRN